MVYGFSPYGAMGSLVRIEIDIRRGLPGTDIIGLVNNEVRESRDRVRSAIRNSGFYYPKERVLISLSPAGIPKVGAGFDLPIALAILQHSGQIQLPEDILAMGELSIQGLLMPIRGVLSGVIAGSERNIVNIIAAEYNLHSLFQAISKETHMNLYTAYSLSMLREKGLSTFHAKAMSSEKYKNTMSLDDIQGQPLIKWASVVAAAGFHNLLLMGPPGSGKTMAARRIVNLLPSLSRPKKLEVARVYSMRGIDTLYDFDKPPMRMPHHSASVEGMVGGGKISLPGEVSLAHNGVLILDEATEFKPKVLQSLREPVENRLVTITRAGRSEQFPALFQLVLTSNLCPCGKLGQTQQQCMCSIRDIEKYWRRLGAALLDRVDIRVRTHYKNPSEQSPSHEYFCEKIGAALERQAARLKESVWKRNGLVPPEASPSVLPLRASQVSLLNERMQALKLSDRAAGSIRAVSWTLADLADRAQVEDEDILEATALRASGSLELLGNTYN